MATATIPTPLDIHSDQGPIPAKPQRLVGKRKRSRAVRSHPSTAAIEEDATILGNDHSTDGDKRADNLGVKRTRSGPGENIDGDSLDDFQTSSSAVAVETPVITANKEGSVRGNTAQPPKKSFNGVVYHRLVAQRRLVNELKAANKEKDQAMIQLKLMWAREKDKNQLLLDRLSVVEQKLITLARPLKRSIANLSRDATSYSWNVGSSSISRSPSSFTSLENRDVAPAFPTES